MIRRFHLADFRTMVARPLDAAVVEVFKHIDSHLDYPRNAPPVPSHPPRSAGRPIRGGGGRNAEKKKEHGRERELTGDDWEAMRNFKPTKIETKTGVDKTIGDLRMVITTITNSTFEAKQIRVVQLLREYFETGDCTEENTAKIVRTIFDLCSSNKLLPALYADLYRELMEEFDQFKPPIESFVDAMIAQEPVPYVDADLDYDEYCKYNKYADKRKASTAFAVCCAKNEVLPSSDLLRLLQWYMSSLDELANAPGNEKMSEEMTEMIFVIASQGNLLLEETNPEKWTELCGDFLKWSKMKSKQVPSITSRAIFKFKDIVDLL